MCRKVEQITEKKRTLQRAVRPRTGTHTVFTKGGSLWRRDQKRGGGFWCGDGKL